MFSVNFQLVNFEEAHRSSRLEVYCKKSVFKNFAKFNRKQLCRSLFLIKLEVAFNIIKKWFVLLKIIRIRSFSGPYSVWKRESTDLRNSEYGHFPRSEIWQYFAVTTKLLLVSLKVFQKDWFYSFSHFLNYYVILFNGIFRNKPLFTDVYKRLLEVPQKTLTTNVSLGKFFGTVIVFMTTLWLLLEIVLF